jgi:hypothetical protein
MVSILLCDATKASNHQGAVLGHRELTFGGRFRWYGVVSDGME